MGKRKMELAEDVLTGTYEGRDVIRFLRSPGSFSGEGRDEMLKAEGTVTDNVPAKYVIQSRMSRAEVFNRLHASRYQLMAYFGPEAAEPLTDLAKIVRQIQVSAWRIDEIQGQMDRTGSEEARRLLQQSYERYSGFLWEGDPETDELVERVDEIVEQVEGFLAPTLSQAPRKFGFFELDRPS
jgi:hypothetical protein